MVRANGKRDVRILLVGEAGVGKTSLILSLVSEQFPEDVPPRAEEITIPADVTPEKVPTRIVDFSTQEQSQENLAEEIGKANVVCIVYAVDDDDTIDKITDYWLPLLREQLGDEHATPVVLVGNKADLVEYSSLEMIVPIMSQYQEVETCVECSAKTFKNISELFYYAQKAVLHPTGPLYLPQERDLTDRCKTALTRVFRICDSDNDGVLSDKELNQFQRRCFNTPLEPRALQDLKAIVAKNLEGGVERDGLTLDGFLFLHMVFIQRGRHETTWTVLRKFGYDDQLVLPREYLCPPIRVPPGSSTELSSKGFQFVTALFEKHDQDEDGCLSPVELRSLFGVCPCSPWAPDLVGTVATDHRGWLTLQGYLAHWALTTALDVHKTFECLAYLGYLGAGEESQLSAVHVTREKQLEVQQRQTSRQVLHCHVLGPQGAGKTSFLRGLLGCGLDRGSHPGSKYAVDRLPVYGQDKYLLLHEVDLFGQHDAPVTPELHCDAVCLLFDASNPRSFEHVARAYLKHLAGSSVPVLLVASKSDRPAVRQDYPIQPAEFCRRHGLPPPQRFTCAVPPSRDVYVKLATMAAYPSLRRLVHVLLVRPMAPWLSRYTSRLASAEASAWLGAGLGAAAAALAGVLLVRLLRTTSRDR
ncbi:mitochondrial Rho GTPase 1 [Ixodes scapularis]|uniref:mitochondrial Rho GTPase 1 n=1 Tax=Ixodes scapularis TaxID=6945 RepID=UPI001161A780|nr:mitochondrial Rho GTPase 1 [Ixodes scapularis]